MVLVLSISGCSSSDGGNEDNTSSSSGGVAVELALSDFSLDPLTAVTDTAGEHTFKFTLNVDRPEDAAFGVGLTAVPNGTSIAEIQSTQAMAIIGAPTREGRTISGRFQLKPPAAGDYSFIALASVGGAQTLGDKTVVISAEAPADK